MLLNMELSGGRKRRLIDVVKESVQILGVTEADVSDRVRWRQAIHCG